MDASANGSLVIDGFSVEGQDANGHFILKREGVYAGTFEKGSYPEHIECIVKVIKALKGEPADPPEDVFRMKLPKENPKPQEKVFRMKLPN